MDVLFHVLYQRAFRIRTVCLLIQDIFLPTQDDEKSYNFFSLVLVGHRTCPDRNRMCIGTTAQIFTDKRNPQRVLLEDIRCGFSVCIVYLDFVSKCFSVSTPASSGSIMMRPQYSQTMIFLRIRISNCFWGGILLKQPPHASRCT